MTTVLSDIGGDKTCMFVGFPEMYDTFRVPLLTGDNK